MKKIATVFVFASLSLSLFGQVNNIVSNAGIAVTNGPPTFVPGPKGSIVAIDSVTGFWWINTNRNYATWTKMGHRLQERSGCTAPSSAPGKHESWFVVNTCAAPEIYLWDGTSAWDCLNCGGGGGGGSINTDATLAGDGSGGAPLKIAQQSASESQVLSWTGATWQPSWGNPYTFVTSGASITSAVNEVLVGTVSADIVLGLPTCNAGLDTKHFKIVRNGTDNFSITIDPSGSQAFYDGSLTKTQYGKLSIDCTCRFSGGTGTWFFDNF